MVKTKFMIVTVLVVIVALLLGGEIFVRVLDKPDNRVCQTAYITTEFCEQFFEKKYLAANLDKKIYEGNYDPDLGWDKMIKKGRTRSGAKFAQKAAAGIVRVVTIGDSNAWGDEIEANETFSHALSESSANFEVLNMGISAYGIDQAALKYLLHGKKYEPHYVILAMNSHDYIRTGLSFFTARKPFFEEQGNGRWLTANTPIARPSEVYEELESNFLWRPRLFEYLRRTYHIFATASDSGNANKTFFEINDRRVASVLGMLQAETEKSGAKLLVVLVPGAYYFKNERTRASYEKLPIPIHMTAILADLGIPLINLFRELPKRAEYEEIYGSYFVKGKDGRLGHPSAKNHRQIANIIMDKICALPGPNKPDCP